MSKNSEQSLLLQLPSEILEHIICIASKIPRKEQYQFSSWQYPEHSYSHLKVLALTCRQLYILCTPYLWRDKEFILPAESDKPNDFSRVHMATDILAEQASLFHQLYHLGSYVRSLCRDLTNSPHYDLPNSLLMAHLVCNLRALRIDFHPKPRTEHYGLRYFVQLCPSLIELYLENCRDTFDDFFSLIQYQRQLRSLTLLNCTIKADTLIQLANLCRGSLQSLLLQQVWIEPCGISDQPLSIISNNNTMTGINNLTTSYLHSNQSTFIASSLYTHLLTSQSSLTRLALSDSVTLEILEALALGSPHLERLAIAIHEQHPSRVASCLFTLSKFKYLTLLSLAFRHVNNSFQQRLSCCVPAYHWTLFLHQLCRLQFLHISASQILVHDNFITELLQQSSSTFSTLQHIMLHHVALVPTPSTTTMTTTTTSSSSSSLMIKQQEQENKNKKNGQSLKQEDLQDTVRAYEQDLALAQNTIDSWQQSSHLWKQVDGYILSLDEAERKGFSCFDSADQVCFVKGFTDWIKT
ncbi:uncharacterized protein BX664DRAFT_383328 [Halteromyces radiatus]|uniref:uncharacterized protein n=1 Tax=Halteromyces radiatus TaxID=101107 RepID=UPI0022211789|nr:uncharacterized protein BX664DRAFT_383328 [Halteromyces radiatus]KAI8096967.1 hypothetical protein BX664DRAFT_383328 [Halteromyces radiatus]